MELEAAVQENTPTSQCLLFYLPLTRGSRFIATLREHDGLADLGFRVQGLGYRVEGF